jgi:hypothetical protein
MLSLGCFLFLQMQKTFLFLHCLITSFVYYQHYITKIIHFIQRETRSKIATNTGGKKTEEIKEKGKTSAKEKGIINEPRLIDTEPTKQEKETQDKIKDEEVSEDEAIENAIMKSIEEQHKKTTLMDNHITHGFSFKVYALITSASKHKFFELTLQNRYKRAHIFFKAYYVIGAIHPMAENQLLAPLFGKYVEAFKNIRFAKVRREPHGANEVKTTEKNGYSYSTETIYMVLELDDSDINDFVATLKRVLRSRYFTTSMWCFINSKDDIKRGPMIESLMDEKSEMWTCLKGTCKTTYDTKIEYYEALDAVLTDVDINKCLHTMFPEQDIKDDSIKKYGWLKFQDKV